MTGALLLAVEEGEVSAGPVGLLILLLMLIATWLLIRNMNARLKRLPREFPDSSEPTDRGPTDRGPTDRGPTDRGPTDRGPTDRGPTTRD